MLPGLDLRAFAAVSMLCTLLACPSLAIAANATPSPEITLERARAQDEMQLEDLKSRHEFENTVLDKLGIAFVLAILGFSLNKALEGYKLREAQRIDWASRRIEASSTVWKAMYTLHGSIVELQAVLAAADEPYAETNVLREQICAIEAEAKNLRILLDQSRFVLGRVAYKRCHAYRRLLLVLLRAYIATDIGTVEQINNVLERLRSDLGSFMPLRNRASS